MDDIEQKKYTIILEALIKYATQEQLLEVNAKIAKLF